MLAAITAACGCSRSRSSSVTLLQPQAPPAQRILKLEGESAFSRRDGHTRTLLLTFPAPGAGRDGSRDFVIFAVMPDRAGVVHVGPLADDSIAGGFLIQAVGKRAGKAAFASGSIRTARDAKSLGREFLELDVRCDDGTRITGRIFPREAPHEILAFERRQAADVAAAIAPHAAPALAAQPTLLHTGDNAAAAQDDSAAPGAAAKQVNDAVSEEPPAVESGATPPESR